MKKIVVTGCAQGMGKSICEKLKEKNYFVIGVDCVSASDFCNEFHQLDLENEDDIVTFCNGFKENTLYGLVNNAAFQVEKKILETDSLDWDKTFAINVKAPFLLSKGLYHALELESAIVNISSVHSLVTSIGLGAYASSKGALSALTKTLSLEFGSTKKIRVNSINPGAIDTPMLRNGLSRNGDPRLALDQITKSSPLGKIGLSSEVANLVDFLLSSELSSNITGSAFNCDSGVLARLASE